MAFNQINTLGKENIPMIKMDDFAHLLKKLINRNQEVIQQLEKSLELLEMFNLRASEWERLRKTLSELRAVTQVANDISLKITSLESKLN